MFQDPDYRFLREGPDLPVDNRLSRMLHVLIHMDRAKAPMTSETIASILSTNPVVVRRTMAGLRTSGYVMSEKGHGGGWRLARPLSEISLLDVHHALGDPEMFSIGFARDHRGCLVEEAVNATISDALIDAQKMLLARFAEVKLSDIADDFDRRMGAISPVNPDGTSKTSDSGM